MKYWLRFYTSSLEDFRPVTVPPPFEWWCTGTDETHAVICGLVEANEGDVLVKVREGWPEVEELDSCEQVPDDWRPSADRFPPAEE